MKDTDKIRELYKKTINVETASGTITNKAFVNLTNNITELLSWMLKIINDLPLESSKIDDIASLKSMCTFVVQNLKHANGEWHFDRHDGDEMLEVLERNNSNILQFCKIADIVYPNPSYEFSRISELIFTLLDLEFDDEADLIKQALKALENGSVYEFCGNIRSSLEKIVVRIVKGYKEDDKKSIFNNLHTLTKKDVIDKKLSKVITSNYSYGSQFVHHERKFTFQEAKVFVDQTLYHIDVLLEKILQKDDN